MRLRPLAAVLSAAALSVCLPAVPAQAQMPDAPGGRAPGRQASGVVEAPVQYKLPDGTTAKGFVAMPADAVSRPGVLVIPEWWGLTEYPKTRARELARHGYVAFVADMYGDGETADTPDKAKELSGRATKAGLAERAAPALERLRSMGPVDGRKVAAIGFCFGGSTVADMVKNGADLKAAVSFHGGLGPDSAPTKGAEIKTPFLVCHGGDDPMVPPAQFAQFVQKSIEAGVPLTVVSFPGAVHAFTNPDADSHGMDGVKYDKVAAERSMAIMYQFFAMTTGDPTGQERAARARADVAAGRTGTYHVDGDVERPGTYAISGDTDVTLRQTLIAAGGYPKDPAADRRVISVARRAEDGADAETIKVVGSDLFASPPKGDMTLRPGDQITVGDADAKPAADPATRPAARAGEAPRRAVVVFREPVRPVPADGGASAEERGALFLWAPASPGIEGNRPGHYEPVQPSDEYSSRLIPLHRGDAEVVYVAPAPH